MPDVPDADRPPLKVDLRLTSEGPDDKGGRGYLIRALWLVVNAVVFMNPVLRSFRLKAWTLRLFGAEIGEDVVFKQGVSVKYPWFLKVGDHSWIGERVWLDCNAPLDIGKHVVISQGAYLCCGTRDFEDPGMGTIQTPIVVEDGAWIAAFALIAGNVTIGQEALVTMGAVVYSDCEPRGAYRGNPAQRVGRRRIRDVPGVKRRPDDRAVEMQAL